MKRNLNKSKSISTDFDNIRPTEASLSDNSVEVYGEIRVKAHFRDLVPALVKEIENADAVVGCVAWLTHPKVIAALAGCRRGVSILVQKEDFLRPDSNPTATWKDELRSGYSRLQPMGHKVAGGWLETTGSEPGESYTPNIAIRCVGEHRAGNQTIPRMHHKFLVFCQTEQDAFGNEYSVPCSVWTGSFNMTINAVSSFENALRVDNEEIAQAYFDEWSQLLLVSEKLNWTSTWVAPDLRINTGQFFT